MKKLHLILIALLSVGLNASAHHYPVINGYGDSFVFDEDGITFSVYPDGEFDFFIEPVINSICVNTAVGGFTFNTGYDYSPYLQYDDYGAVIQVENVPIYYDYYGRVSQIGNVAINYRNRRVSRVGGLVVYYNSYGHFTHCSGFVNVWNPYFVYRPMYTYFARPIVNLCLVSFNPYRRHYRPVRHVYYRPYAPRVRPHYATIGHTYTPSGHVVSSYYRQAARSNETAYHRGHKKITKEYVAKNPSRIAAASAAQSRSNANRLSNQTGMRNSGTASRTSSGGVSKPATTTTRNNSGRVTNSSDTRSNRHTTAKPIDTRSNSGVRSSRTQTSRSSGQRSRGVSSATTSRTTSANRPATSKGGTVRSNASASSRQGTASSRNQVSRQSSQKRPTTATGRTSGTARTGISKSNRSGSAKLGSTKGKTRK